MPGERCSRPGLAPEAIACTSSSSSISDGADRLAVSNPWGSEETSAVSCSDLICSPGGIDVFALMRRTA